MDVASLNHGRFHAQRFTLFRKGIKSGTLSLAEIDAAVPDSPENESIRVLLLQSLKASGIRIVEGNMVAASPKLQVLLVGGNTDIRQNIERNMKRMNAPFEFCDHWGSDKSKSMPYRAIPKGVVAVIMLYEFISHNIKDNVQDACKDQNVKLIHTRHQWIQFRQECHRVGLWVDSKMYPGIVPAPFKCEVRTIVEAKPVNAEPVKILKGKPMTAETPVTPVAVQEKTQEEKTAIRAQFKPKLTEEQYAERELFIVELIKKGEGPFRIGRACKEKYDTLVSPAQIRSIANRHNLTVANRGNPRIDTTNTERLLSVPVNVTRDTEIKSTFVTPDAATINAAHDFKAALELLKSAMTALKVRSITAFFDGDKLKTKIEKVQEDSFDV